MCLYAHAVQYACGLKDDIGYPTLLTLLRAYAVCRYVRMYVSAIFFRAKTGRKVLEELPHQPHPSLGALHQCGRSRPHCSSSLQPQQALPSLCHCVQCPQWCCRCTQGCDSSGAAVLPKGSGPPSARALSSRQERCRARAAN